MSDSEENRAKDAKLIKKSTQIILLGLTILTGLSLYVISLSPTMEEMVEAGRPVERSTIVDLFLLKQVSKSEFSIIDGEIDGKLGQGVKIAFNLSSNVPVHVALLSSVYQKTPDILFVDAKIPPGENRQLDIAGDRFIFTTTENQGHIKFCLVQADTSVALLKKLSQVRDVWQRIPDSQCAEIDVN